MYSSFGKQMTRNSGVCSSVPPSTLQASTNLSVSPARPHSGLSGLCVEEAIEQATLSPPGPQQDISSSVSPDVFLTAQPTNGVKIRPFIMGLASSATGIAIILAIALGLLQLRRITGDFTTPVLSLLAVFSVLLIGTGFGMMVLSSGGFDQTEFDRLIETGNTCSSEMPDVSFPRQMELEVLKRRQFRENDSASNTAAATGLHREV